MTASPSGRSGVSHPAGWARAVALLALVALAAMHGPSAGHMLMAAPGGGAAMSHRSVVADVPTAAPGHVMDHGECVAVLPDQGGAQQPSLCGSAAVSPVPQTVGGRTARIVARAPPCPVLSELCISRT